MKDYKTIEIEIDRHIATIWLNRPEIHNAFNETMISEVMDCIDKINHEETIRIVLLRGKGKSFCAGADLNWMRDVATYTYEENYRESYQLSKCFYAIYSCHKPTIAVVHGAAIGGANGLLAACDFAYADDQTVFSLSEVKIGIVPACISPYVIKRVGEYPAKDLMLTGKRFNGPEAEDYKLVNKSVAADQMEAHIKSVCELLSSSGPAAVSQCKALIHDVANNLNMEDALDYTAKMIADIRMSDEGQEGMAAFLEKRKPNWVKEQN
ncbi:MAG: enoyl-CoA hydratase/isomerase family protein [Bacteroidales bacterium]|nr:enoyl-CoA hydratase/isomerase family protein [Bacteroidales bacterium]